MVLPKTSCMRALVLCSRWSVGASSATPAPHSSVSLTPQQMGECRFDFGTTPPPPPLASCHYPRRIARGVRGKRPPTPNHHRGDGRRVASHVEIPTCGLPPPPVPHWHCTDSFPNRLRTSDVDNFLLKIPNHRVHPEVPTGTFTPPPPLRQTANTPPLARRGRVVSCTPLPNCFALDLRYPLTATALFAQQAASPHFCP